MLTDAGLQTRNVPRDQMQEQGDGHRKNNQNPASKASPLHTRAYGKQQLFPSAHWGGGGILPYCHCPGRRQVPIPWPESHFATVVFSALRDSEGQGHTHRTWYLPSFSAPYLR